MLSLLIQTRIAYDAAFLARDFATHSVAKPRILKFIPKSLSWCKPGWHDKQVLISFQMLLAVARIDF